MTRQPYNKHRRVASFVRAAPEDRRVFQRYQGDGLMVMIQGQQIEVHDFSLGGMKLKISGLSVGSVIEVLLVPRQGMALLSDQSIKTKVIVQGQADDHARLTFSQVTFSLAKVLIQQMAKKNGLQPFIFR